MYDLEQKRQPKLTTDKTFLNKETDTIFKEIAKSNSRTEKTSFAPVIAGSLIEPHYLNELYSIINKEINYRKEFYKNNPQYSKSVEPKLRINELTGNRGELVYHQLASNIMKTLNNLNYMIDENFEQEYNKLRSIINKNEYQIGFYYKDKLITIRKISYVNLNNNDIVINYTDNASYNKLSTDIPINSLSVKIAIINPNKVADFLNNLVLSSFSSNAITLSNKKLTLTDYKQGDLIKAEIINDMHKKINSAEVMCLCDCNYCTCDCNYCTCDCNYCTCDCNYCTCDCNYCTCDCNYCTCDCNFTTPPPCTCDCNFTAPPACPGRCTNHQVCPCDCNFVAPPPCPCDCNYCGCNCNYCTCNCNYTCTRCSRSCCKQG